MRPVDVLTAVMVAAIWGFGFTLSKAALAGFPPIFLMALRFTLTAALLVWFVKPPTGYMWKVALISMVGAGIQYSVTFTGSKRPQRVGRDHHYSARGTDGRVTCGSFPQGHYRLAAGIWNGCGVCGRGDPGRRYLRSGCLDFGASGSDRRGLFRRRPGHDKGAEKGAVGGFQLTAWVSVFAFPQLFVISFLTEDNHWQYVQNADQVVWLTVLYLAFIMTALGYSLWYRLIAKYSINVVMPFILLVPFSTVISAVLLLDEALSPYVLIGGLTTIAGVMLITFRDSPFRRKRPVEAAKTGQT